eukprot:3411052-Rhodomonas_salina.1
MTLCQCYDSDSHVTCQSREVQRIGSSLPVRAKVLRQLLFSFEGIIDEQAFNLPAYFNSTWLISSCSTKQNICQLDSLCKESTVEITKLYNLKDLPTFLSVLCINYLVNMIHNLANLDSEDRDSWQTAKSHLQQESLAHCTILIKQAGITHTDKHVVSFDGKCYTLSCISCKPGAAKGCTIADSLLVEDASENLLSLAQLLLNSYSVDFQISSATDKQFGCVITTPKGQKITMVFSDNLWLLPLWAPAPATKAALHVNAARISPVITADKPFASLLTIADVEEERACPGEDVQAHHLSTWTLPELLHTTEQLQVICNQWCHPGRTKALENF